MKIKLTDGRKVSRALRVLMALLMLTSAASTASAANGKDTTMVYNEARPLIYEDAWDLWPYVFLNENGEPDGYNIDLLKMIFKELDIPYVVRLKPTLEAQSDLRERKSDLMLRMDASFSRNNASYGQSIVQLFTHSVVTPRSKKIVINSGKDLKDHTIIVHEGSFSHHLIKNHGWAADIMAYDDMQEAIQRVSAEDDGIIIWNTMSLKWLMQKYQTTNLQIEPIELPYGEYKFFSNDHHLLNQLDSVYAQLRANDRLTPIQNKWFYPERKETGIPSWIWDLIVIIAAIAMGIVIYFIIYKVRENKMTREVRMKNQRLGQILKTSHVGLWIYDVDAQVFTLIDQNGKAEKSYSSLEFSRRYDPADFKNLIEALKQLIENKADNMCFKLTKTATEESGEMREYTATLSVLRRNKHNRPNMILCSGKDITEERKRQAEVKDNRLRYQSIFNSAMIDMVAYDKDGYIVDMNEKAINAMPVDIETIRKQKISVQQVMGMDDLDIHDFDYIYVTQLYKDDDLGDDRPLNKFLRRERMAYELQLMAIRGKQGELLGVYGSGRDVSEVARSYHQLRQNVEQLKDKHDEVTNYVRNIDYVLSVGGISLMKYNTETHILTIYSEINKAQYTLTQTRALTLVSEEHKHRARRIFNKMDNKQKGNYHEDIRTIVRKKSNIPLHLMIHFIPTLKNGEVVEYFGMCRDISDLKAVEAQLAQETVRAQEVEVVKNAFLHNMSHEIRTPLNSVVGFSELFEMDHNLEDEAIFIKEIKESSAALLKLINDILFLSRLDAKMVEINVEPTDFAQTFEVRCEQAWMNGRKEGVKYIAENQYDKLVVNIDENNVGRIMTQIIENSVKYTVLGTVRARYEYIGGRLIIAVEDTGEGIPADKLPHIFERFNDTSADMRGTGLGLPICYELAAQLGGTIEVNSERGKGTMVWIIIPCEASVVEHKKEI